jgi:hypothetical protein
MLASARALLNGIVDYAGTFPPAGLTLREAFEQYRQAKAGADGWLIGRFILPAASMPEFEELTRQAVAQGFSPADATTAESASCSGRSRRRGGEALAFISRGRYASHRSSFRRSAPRTFGPWPASWEAVESFFSAHRCRLERRIGAIGPSGARASAHRRRPRGVPNPADRPLSRSLR